MVESLGSTEVKLTDAEVKFALTHAASNGTLSMDVPSIPIADQKLPILLNVDPSINGSIVNKPETAPGMTNAVTVSDRSNVWGGVEDSSYTTMFTTKIKTVQLTVD